MIRCFAALDMPPEIKAGLTELCQTLRAHFGKGVKLNWARSDGIHLTLKFLGDVAEERLSQINLDLGVALAQVKPFDLKMEGLGCFPNPAAPRVIWIGVAGDLTALHHAQKRTEAALAPLGFPPEKRAFSPHITLAYVPDIRLEAKAEIGRILQDYKGSTSFGTANFTQAVLMQSLLKPDGAFYTPIHHFDFVQP